MDLRAASIEDFVSRLASRDPAPGGGAVAGLLSGLGAALASMVANFTTGPKHEERAADVQRVLGAASDLIKRSLAAAEEDAVAFEAVTDAYKLPKETDEDKAARTAAIQAALHKAAEVPVEAAELSAAALPLCEELLEYGNRNVISDVGVAAACIRAAIDSAIINIAINAGAIKDEQFAAYLNDRIAAVRAAAEAAGALVRQVEEQVSA